MIDYHITENEYDYLHVVDDQTFITRMKNIKRACVEEAIRLSESFNLYINYEDDKDFRLHWAINNGCKDLTKFWKVYGALQNSKEWQVYELLLNLN